MRTFTSYAAMVQELTKPGEEILSRLTPWRVNLIHMAFGIAGEAGELLDAIKKFTIYNKPMDTANIVEELGDLEFFMEGIRAALDITREECLAANMKKLGTRYADGYSDQAAQLRVDKNENTCPL